MQHVRLDHDSQRQLLQVRELRNDERLRLTEGIRSQEPGIRLGKGQGIRSEAPVRTLIIWSE